MALSANTVWEIRTTGNDNNGGAFVTGASGSDFSQQNAAQATLSAASTINAVTTIINVALGDYTVTANDVGNLLQITGGTATAGFYQITVADTINNRWTVDRSAGTAGQTVVGAMGGALASPAKTVPVGGNIVYIKSGTYSMSVNTNNVSNGKWSKAIGMLIVGYNTNRFFGNTDTRPLIQATVALTTMWDGSTNWVYNIDFDANSQASTRCVNAGAYTRCSFRNATSSNNMLLATHCSATGNSGTPFLGTNAVFAFCEAYDNTATGFSCNNCSCFNCISDSNSGASSDGFIVPALGSGHFFNCIAYNNGRDGFRTTTGASVSRMILTNCIAESNAGWGANSLAANFPSLTSRCAFYNNTSGATTGTITDVAALTPTGSVFTNAAAADFSLNATANRGALLRAAGYVDINTNVYLRGLTTSYIDVGAAQHQDTGGGGGGEHSAVF